MAERPYEPDKPSLTTVSRLASREAARRECDRVVASVDHRIAELARVVGEEGLTLDLTPGSLQSLEEWFLESVRPDPDGPGRLDAVWYAIAHDIGLYAGEVLIRAAPRYHWGLSENPDSQYYHRCVVTGVVDVEGNMWEWDPGQTVGDLGHQRIAGSRLRSPFLRPMVEELIEYADE